jgi:hypothetical protein
MVFDVYGRFEIEVCQQHGLWVAYRLGPGMRCRDYDIVLPSGLAEGELAAALADMLQNVAIPGLGIRRVR